MLGKECEDWPEGRAMEYDGYFSCQQEEDMFYKWAHEMEREPKGWTTIPHSAVDITTDPAEAPADALLEAAGYYVEPGDKVRSLYSPVGMVHYHVRDAVTLGGHYTHELTGWDPYSWDVPRDDLKDYRPTGAVTSLAGLREWIATLRADDLFNGVQNPTIVLSEEEAKWWEINESATRPVCAHVHGVRIREAGHEDMPDPPMIHLFTVDVGAMLGGARGGKTDAVAAKRKAEAVRACTRCNGTGRVAGALGVGIEWPCECVGGAG